VYTEKLLTSELFLFQASEVPSSALLLFGGDLEHDANGDANTNELSVNEGFARFALDSRSAGVILRARAGIERLLDVKLHTPSVNVQSAARPLIEAVLAVLRWEDAAQAGGEASAYACMIAEPVHESRQKLG
jgi:hypothetical protein